jgi:organic radical activating enzyme
MDIGCRKITITGGEPLLQEAELLHLINILLQGGFHITVETNGSLEIPYLYQRKNNLGWVVDYKLNYPDQMLSKHFITLTSNSFVKILVKNKKDYRLAVQVKSNLQNLGCQARFAFSPLFDDAGMILNAEELVEWLVKDNLFDVHVNVQIHKLIGVA